MKGNNKILLLLLLIIISFDLYSQKELLKDTTIIMAFEKCSDSTYFNCWNNFGDIYSEIGLIPFDSNENIPKYENGYYVFIYGMSTNDGRPTNGYGYINYLGKEADTSDCYLKLADVQYSFEFMLDSLSNDSNELYIINDIQNNRLKKSRVKDKINKQIPFYLAMTNKFSGNRLFYLFKMHIKYVNPKIKETRLVLSLRSNSVRLKKVNYNYYYIVNIISVEPYKLKP